MWGISESQLLKLAGEFFTKGGMYNNIFNFNIDEARIILEKYYK
jgi:hypothetical protein|tara:strand:- start:53 stop:184 length:132 start_codon:yes stop_codon:yes gene_type:complete